MKKFIPLICIAAVIAGCGKVDQASKKDSMPVVKGGTVTETDSTENMTDEEKVEKTSESKTQSENYKPADKVRGGEKQEPSSRSAYIAGQRSGSAPAQVYIPKPVKPPARSGRSTENTTDTEDPSQTATDPSGTVEKAPPRAVYSAALGGILKEGNAPVYGQVDTDLSAITSSEFAVADVDGDGAEELIFVYNSNASAGMFAEVYGIDDEGKLYEKINAFLAMTFYSNGTLTVDFSHTNKPSGGFSSYTLYTFNASSKRYETVAEVQALDKAEIELLKEEAEANGTEPQYVYPEEADTSGSGKVYYIAPSGSSGDPQPCDVTEYQAWLSQYTDGAYVVSPDYKKLTAENIKSLTE